MDHRLRKLQREMALSGDRELLHRYIQTSLGALGYVELTDLPASLVNPDPPYLYMSDEERVLIELYPRLRLYGEPVNYILEQGLELVREACWDAVASFEGIEPAGYDPLFHIQDIDAPFRVQHLAFAEVGNKVVWDEDKLARFHANQYSFLRLINMTPTYRSSGEPVPQIITPHPREEIDPKVISGARLYISGQFFDPETAHAARRRRGSYYGGARLLIEFILTPIELENDYEEYTVQGDVAVGRDLLLYRLFHPLWQQRLEDVRHMANWSGLCNMVPRIRPFAIYSQAQADEELNI